MRTRYFVRAGSAALAVLAITIFGTVFVNAQSGAPVGGTNATPTVTVLGNRILQRTAFAANNSNVTTTCGTSGCTTSTAVFNQSVVCPQFAGKSCTLYIYTSSPRMTSASTTMDCSNSWSMVSRPILGQRIATGCFAGSSTILTPKSLTSRLDPTLWWRG